MQSGGLQVGVGRWEEGNVGVVEGTVETLEGRTRNVVQQVKLPVVALMSHV